MTANPCPSCPLRHSCMIECETFMEYVDPPDKRRKVKPPKPEPIKARKPNNPWAKRKRFVNPWTRNEKRMSGVITKMETRP